MVNLENIQNFINYGYQKFSKKQCIKRLIFLWLLSLICCVTGTNNLPWMVGLFLFITIISVLFLYLILFDSSSKISRFLCDGITFLYVSILLLLISYRISVIHSKENLLLLLIYLIIWICSISSFSVIVFLNIKANNYAETKRQSGATFFPLLAGGVGMCVARFLLSSFSDEAMLQILSLILLLLSLITGIGSISIVKAILLRRTGGRRGTVSVKTH